MEAEIYSWVKNIIIYMIINTVIMNLLGNKSYKKYVSIVSGMVLVLIVVSPLTRFMKLDENLDYFMQSNDFSIETSEFKSKLNQMEEEQTDAIFADYEQKIKVQVEEMLLKEKVRLTALKVNINRNKESPNFGGLSGMNITAEMIKEEEMEEDDRLRIEEIVISDIKLNKNDENPSQNVPSPMEIELKNKLSDFYNIEQGNININIQGG